MGSLDGKVTKVGGSRFFVASHLETVRNFKFRQFRMTKLNFDVRSLRNEQGGVARLRVLGEESSHLLSTLEVMLLSVEAEPLLIQKGRPRLDAK